MLFSYQIDNELKLVLPTERNAEELYELVRENLAELKLWMPWATSDYSLESTRGFIKNLWKEMAENTGFGASVVFHDKFVGQVGFHNFDLTSKSARIGYWLAKSAQGKGLMTKCCRALIDHAFDDLNLNRIQINCNIENIKSRAIPERLDFKLEGIHRQVEWLNGEFRDWAVYAMLKEEWKNQ
jgi:ribosomal-protein-serine acetyltransferase